MNDDNTSVRRPSSRKLPVDDELYRANLKARTCYAERFPREDAFFMKKEKKEEQPSENETEKTENKENGDEIKAEVKSEEVKPNVEPATLDEIYDWLEKQELTAETVAMRKVKNKDNAEINGKFTGSCFITFCTLADAQKFIEGDAKFRGECDIVKKTKHAYWTEQNARQNAKKKGENVEAAVSAAKKQLEAEKPPTWKEGCVVKFDGVKDATLKREDVKMFLVEKDGAVEYISFEWEGFELIASGRGWMYNTCFICCG